MYCIYNATSLNSANEGNPLGWPFESKYGFFCDSRDKWLPLLSSGALSYLSIVLAYLLVVLHLGPRWMANRKPLEIRNLIRAYNLIMISWNIHLLRRAMPLVANGRAFFACSSLDLNQTQANEIANTTELFLWIRLADFLDTIWFVLRKKQSHVSFIHVFHHAYAPSLPYLGTRWLPVAPVAMLFPFVNAFLHVIVYGYYFLAAFPALRRHLWWKRYITSLQMAQFVVVIAYNGLAAILFNESTCGKSRTTILASSSLSAAIFFILFWSYFKRTYCAPAKANSDCPLTPAAEPQKRAIKTEG